ncbi:hypothetical protein [Peribacillus alkalitolerans]|uniref:hypothetical protein n=1 Tax=Peribacillus alkalitolerans TaxID=1550385 RepID=UPI0013D03D1D|nr:hypothetical protein [Peribacillus alkalitolerans]
MKFIKFILIPVFILVAAGYGVYFYGTNLASEKLMDAVSTELENSGQIEEIKTYVEGDHELKQFIEEAGTVDQSKLPFQTKEEATRVLIKKVGISELQDIQSKVKAGTASKEEIIQDLESKLTEEEIMALKVIAYKEIYNK